MLNQTEYIYGVHCGDGDCYSCATQRYNCDELNRKDDNQDEVDRIHKIVAKRTR